MAPSGLVINKLGVQATAADDRVKGLLCLKISLPRETDGRPGARWALFSSNPPALTSTPSIYPLPLPLPASRLPSCKLASKLLSLPLPTSYPPSPQTPLGEKPYIDVSSTTGKIAVVMDPSPTSRRNSRGTHHGGAGSSSAAKSSRRDWLVCMEFEVGLENGMEEGISKVLLPLPKCLDNVIRFQITSPTNATGEVSILTEPKMLPLPSSAFSRPSPSPQKPPTSTANTYNAKGKNRAILGEEGWEDGEDLGPEDLQSDEESEPEQSADDSDEGGGSWLEGRFQSTDVLRLEWSYNPSSGSEAIPSLQISPLWDKRHPSISLVYTAQISDHENPVQLEVDVPDDWAWSELIIQGEGLTGWQCVDGGWNTLTDRDPDETLDGAEYEDSFATIRARRAGDTAKSSKSSPSPNPSYLPHSGPGSAASSSASLMRQTFPAPIDMKMEDYSFELSASMEPPKSTHSAPATLKKSPLAANPMLVSSTRSSVRGSGSEIKSGRIFNVYFDSDDDSTEKTLALQGTLIPNSKSLLVSSTLPIRIPLVVVNGQRDTQCQMQCPNAQYGSGTLPTSDVELVQIEQGGIFGWTDDNGQPLPPKSMTIRGDVRIKLRKSVWGVISANITFPFPRLEDEAGFLIPYQAGGEVKFSRATIDGIPIPKSVYDDGTKVDLRMGKREGKAGGAVSMELEILPSSTGVVTLPIFEGNEGEVSVTFVGEEWIPLLKNGLKTTLQTSGSSQPSFTYPPSSIGAPAPTMTLPSPSIPIPSPSTKSSSKSRTLFSFSTLFNLFLIWLVISMGQQIQRLRNEVAFVVDETRDLRMYGLAQTQTYSTETSVPTAFNDQDARGSIVDVGHFAVTTKSGLSRADSATAPNLNGPQIERDSTSFPASTGNPFGEDHESAMRNDEVVVQENKKISFPLGRVVWGVERGWERWISHPT
ncbi:hypothetical protein IAT40_002404 [Kwoniella sp. CBS 6097]